MTIYPDPDAPLRLTFVADATSIHVQRWLQWLVAHGHRVVCLSDKQPTSGVGFAVVPLPNRNTLLADGKPASKTNVVWARAQTIAQWLSAHPCDVLHAHFIYMRGWSAALAQALLQHDPASNQPPPPLAITLLGSDIYLPKRHYRHLWHLWRDNQLNRWSLLNAQWITGASMALCADAQKLTRRWGHPSPNIDWTPIGTDLRLFHPGYRSGPAVQALKASLNIPEGAYVVLSPRQVTPTYNTDVIIDAFAQALPKLQPEHLVDSKATAPWAVLVIKDTTADTPERKTLVAKLKRQINQAGIGHAVRWVDHVPFEQMPTFYAMADVIISIPKTDGFPVTLFEAMACHTPVITTDLPAYAPVVVANQSALVVANRQGQVLASEVANALVSLHTNPSLVLRLKQRGFDMVSRHGQFEHVMARVEAHYRGLVAQQAEPSHRSWWTRFEHWKTTTLLKALIQWT
jgi:glycosyltransferase involved in cell wall biosynthesis